MHCNALPFLCIYSKSLWLHSQEYPSESVTPSQMHPWCKLIDSALPDQLRGDGFSCSWWLAWAPEASHALAVMLNRVGCGF